MRAKLGFSLVELSIVLVILGLLVGGILAGQSLIRAAELRSVGVDIQRYTAALNTFRDKYFYLPGDIPNAASIWGTAANCPGNETQGSTDATTCNGDGNGQVYHFATSSREPFRAWQQLASAGLVEGRYTGVYVSTGAGFSSSPGVNIPQSRLANVGIDFYWVGPQNGSSSYFAGNYNNAFIYAAANLPNGVGNPFLKPEEAWNIDSKIDDGLPGSGTISSFTQHTNCYVSASAYRLTDTSQRCAIVAKTGL